MCERTHWAGLTVLTWAKHIRNEGARSTHNKTINQMILVMDFCWNKNSRREGEFYLWLSFVLVSVESIRISSFSILPLPIPSSLPFVRDIVRKIEIFVRSCIS